MNTNTHPETASTLTGVSEVATTNNSGMTVSTNPQAPVSCRKRIIIKASPEKVWAVLTDIDNWATWQTDISKPVLKDDLKPGAAFDWKTGGAPIHSRLHTVGPNKYFGWTGKTFGMYAIHNWTLTDVPEGTEVVVDETMEGLLARLFSRSFNRNLAAGMQRWLDLLKIESER